VNILHSEKAMRIAVVSTPFVRVPPHGYGGTELFCSHLAEALLERGHDVTLFATGDSEFSGELKACFPTARGSSGHRLFVSAFMLASKVICDDIYSNKSWNIFAIDREHEGKNRL